WNLFRLPSRGKVDLRHLDAGRSVQSVHQTPLPQDVAVADGFEPGRRDLEDHLLIPRGPRGIGDEGEARRTTRERAHIGDGEAFAPFLAGARGADGKVGVELLVVEGRHAMPFHRRLPGGVTTRSQKSDCYSENSILTFPMVVNARPRRHRQRRRSRLWRTARGSNARSPRAMV